MMVPLTQGNQGFGIVADFASEEEYQVYVKVRGVSVI
jgi:hypothetical protein